MTKTSRNRKNSPQKCFFFAKCLEKRNPLYTFAAVTKYLIINKINKIIMQNSIGFIGKLKEISLKKQEDLQQYFKEVAEYLFRHVLIKAGNDEYTFIEVEFYYYQDGDFKGPLYNCTYPRTRKAGQLFWHYSGVDICFESSENEGFFGGILIRGLKKYKEGLEKNNYEIIAGPMRCSDELMNSCEKELPIIVDGVSLSINEPQPTIRYGIKADVEQSEPKMFFCYYLEQESWNRTRKNVLVADKDSGGYKKVTKTDYYTARPDKRI